MLGRGAGRSGHWTWLRAMAGIDDAADAAAGQQRQPELTPIQRVQQAPAAGQEMASLATAIPEELLAEIFIRLPDPADLARVSATCPIFRRLATDRSFLRRYRKLHPPPFLGFVDGRKAFHPALPPHPSAPAARAVPLAADFSFSYLPTPARSWVVQDVRDGRVLLLDCDPHVQLERRVFTDVAVCDPLYRQYILLPSVPHDLAASVEDPPAPMRWCEPFFLPRGEENDDALAEETTFRVVWMADLDTKLAVFEFSSRTGQWRVASSKFWGDLFPTSVMSKVKTGKRMLCGRRYVYGCFCWMANYWWEKMLQLDIGKMELYTDFPPRGYWWRPDAIKEAGEGRHGMIFAGTGYKYTSDLEYTIRQDNGHQYTDQWQLEKPSSIPFGYRYDISDVTEKHMVLEMTKEEDQEQDFEYFSLTLRHCVWRGCVIQSIALLVHKDIQTSRHPCCRRRQYVVVCRKVLRRGCWNNPQRCCKVKHVVIMIKILLTRSLEVGAMCWGSQIALRLGSSTVDHKLV